MAAPALLSAWQARFLGLTSTSGRHAASLGPPQPCRARPAASGSAGTSSSKRRLASPCAAVGYDDRSATARPAGAPGNLLSRLPPSPAQLQQLQRAVAPSDTEVTQQQQWQQDAASAASDPPVTSDELERRAKISAANKGRTPWNKGRRHSPETIARIRQRTKEAMQRPEVKQRLAEANEKRMPHTDRTKATIRAKLQKRAAFAREEINEQAAIILDRLRASDDPAISKCADYPKAIEVVAGLAWQYYKKDWHLVSTEGWREGSEFRLRTVAKLRQLVDKASAPPAARRRKGVNLAKVLAARDLADKVQEAREKVANTEINLAKLQSTRAAFANDPARLAAVEAAEAKAALLISKLRSQVMELEARFKPLRKYLELDDAFAGETAEAVAHQRELVRRLEPQQQREEGAGADTQGANSAAPGQAAAEAAGAAGSGHVVSGFRIGEVGEGAAGVDGHVNGSAAEHSASGPSALHRSTMPWQQ